MLLPVDISNGIPPLVGACLSDREIQEIKEFDIKTLYYVGYMPGRHSLERMPPSLYFRQPGAQIKFRYSVISQIGSGGCGKVIKLSITNLDD